MNRRKRRAGFVMVCVIACTGIVMSIALVMTQASLRQRDVVRQERQLRQAQLLVEAGHLRATEKLIQDQDYQGEAWQLTREGLPGFESALVKITVTRQDDDTQPRILVVARLPADSDRAIQRSGNFLFPQSTESE